MRYEKQSFALHTPAALELGALQRMRPCCLSEWVAGIRKEDNLGMRLEGFY